MFYEARIKGRLAVPRHAFYDFYPRSAKPEFLLISDNSKNLVAVVSNTDAPFVLAMVDFTALESWPEREDASPYDWRDPMNRKWDMRFEILRQDNPEFENLNRR